MASVNEKLTAIADAIREKTEKSAPLSLDAMREEIEGMITKEIVGHADMPEYVKAEALRVVNRVLAVRQSDSIVFIAMSDNHHYGAQKDSDTWSDQDGIQTDVGNMHAAQAAKMLAYALKVDFMAHLGDDTWGHRTTTPELLKKQGGEFRKMMREVHGDVPCFHAIGNHDTGFYYHQQMNENGSSGVFTLDGEYLFENYTALSESEDTVFDGEENGGYCYRDFPEKKLRVFLLNTSESLVANQTDKAMLDTQLAWLRSALEDLNRKADATEWKFIILSHYPADYGNAMQLSVLLEAYVKERSYYTPSEGDVYYVEPFFNIAQMIAQFHGHVHNFLASKLYNQQQTQYDAWRVCIPNGQFNRENYYSTVGSYTNINFKQDVTYGKTAGTAKDTSFVVNVINPTEQVIHSICYGAGVDRVIGYGDASYYTVTSTLTNVTSSNNARIVEAGQPYSATLTIPDGYEWRRVIVKMGGVDVTASVYSNGVINIPSVTGDVSITASASEITSYTNQIPISTDASGAIYNGVGYKADTYLSGGNEGTKSGIYTTGFIPCKIGDKLYCKNVGMMAQQDAHRLCFYDSNKAYLNIVKTTAAYNGFNYGADGNLEMLQIGSSGDNSATAYIRLCCGYIGDDSVITVNEEIE